MPIYGRIQEKGLFEDAAMRRLEEERAQLACEDTLEVPTGAVGPSRRFFSRTGSFEMAQAALRGGGVGIPYAGEHPQTVLPHPMPDDHRNFPA